MIKLFLFYLTKKLLDCKTLHSTYSKVYLVCTELPSYIILLPLLPNETILRPLCLEKISCRRTYVLNNKM